MHNDSSRLLKPVPLATEAQQVDLLVLSDCDRLFFQFQIDTPEGRPRKKQSGRGIRGGQRLSEEAFTSTFLI